MAEVIVTDPITGGMKGQKDARFDLIPNEFEWALARHYGVGSKKYTTPDLTISQVDEIIGKSCTCAKLSTPKENVVLVTKKGYDSKTQHTLNASEKIVGSGPGLTPTPKKSDLGWQHGENGCPSSASHSRMSDEYSKNRMVAPFATTDRTAVGSTSTTITTLANLGGFSAERATKELATWPMTQTVLNLHETTCYCTELGLVPSEKGVQVSGDRNWERGYRWSLSVGALRRHLSAWLSGESVDPETGSNHLIAVAWHAIALFIFELRGLGTDDVRSSSR